MVVESKLERTSVELFDNELSAFPLQLVITRVSDPQLRVLMLEKIGLTRETITPLLDAGISTVGQLLLRFAGDPGGLLLLPQIGPERQAKIVQGLEKVGIDVYQEVEKEKITLNSFILINEGDITGEGAIVIPVSVPRSVKNPEMKRIAVANARAIGVANRLSEYFIALGVSTVPPGPNWKFGGESGLDSPFCLVIQSSSYNPDRQGDGFSDEEHAQAFANYINAKVSNWEVVFKKNH